MNLIIALGILKINIHACSCLWLLAFCASLFEEGGDWERKNRLKVYEGLYCMSTRNFKKAANLFLDSISTFTTYELFPYDTFIFYTVLTSIISLDRVSLKQKVHPQIFIRLGFLPFLVLTWIIGMFCNYIINFNWFPAGSWCPWDIDGDRKSPISFRIFELFVWLSI